jgi:hypothetical protein
VGGPLRTAAIAFEGSDPAGGSWAVYVFKGGARNRYQCELTSGRATGDFLSPRRSIKLESATSASDELERLAALKERGDLSPQEFDEAKAKLLRRL